MGLRAEWGGGAHTQTHSHALTDVDPTLGHTHTCTYICICDRHTDHPSCTHTLVQSLTHTCSLTWTPHSATPTLAHTCISDRRVHASPHNRLELTHTYTHTTDGHTDTPTDSCSYTLADTLTPTCTFGLSQAPTRCHTSAVTCADMQS